MTKRELPKGFDAQLLLTLAKMAGENPLAALGVIVAVSAFLAVLLVLA